jgi:glycosyltransferase involved in cell wall biosynthesis
MKVSLVSTVLNAREFIEDFVESVRAQSRPPDEVIVVDGGSTDGTWEFLRATEEIRALSAPGSNISQGRNAAVRAATHDVLAVTDADCVLDPSWLARILEPIERGADVSAGFYLPLASSLFEIYASSVSIREPDEIRTGWLPSSRSIALHRRAWQDAGGYPEWLDVGEDMYFNHRLRDAGMRMQLAPDALTYFRIRPSLSSTWTQFARYAQGDAEAGMYVERHVLRFGAYAFAGTALLRMRWLLPLAAAGGLAHVRQPIRRAWRRLPDRPEARWGSLAVVPALVAFVDAAKMWGYIRGLAERWQARRS